MKNKGKKMIAVLMTGILCFTVLSGCSSKAPSASGESSAPSQSSASAKTSESTEMVDDGQETMEGIYRPADMTIPRMEKYDLPEIGLEAVLPESLMQRMDKQEVAMLSDVLNTDDDSAIKYALLSWSTMNEEQREAEIDIMTDEFFEWRDSLERIGTLGIYQADLIDQLDELTGCDEHQELGKSADGAYKYYLSTNSKADNTLTSEVREIQATIKEMAVPEDNYDDTTQTQFKGTSVGEFTTQDINGQTYTQDIFKDYELTMVNIFATWCSPCVAEIPDLEKLRQSMADQGIKVNVVGVVLDVLNEKGEIDQEGLERAKLLAEKTGATYPFLIPDASYMNGRLMGIQAVPETFFVDKDGNIVGETYSGSGSVEDWTSVVEKELANLREGK